MSQQTFAWASLRVVKVPLNDVLVIVAVTVITVFTDLATAVLCGIIIAALNFAWQQARELYADSHLEADGGGFTCCMARCSSPRQHRFLSQFDPAGDPPLVTIDCRHPELRRLLGHRRAQDPARTLRRAGKHLRALSKNAFSGAPRQFRSRPQFR